LEYEYLLKPVRRFDERKSRNGEEQKFEILTNSQKQKLELLRKSPSLILQEKRPDLTDTAHFVRHILHNFEILKGRKVELEKKITLYYA